MARWFQNAATKLGVVAMAAMICALSASDPVNAQSRRRNGGGDATPGDILNTNSVWRIFTVLRPPMIQYDDGIKPLKAPYEWVDQETPFPEEGWNAIAFPDQSWLRQTANGHPKTPYAANLFLRGRFEVTDPADVKDLKLSVTYHGGVIVYVNGQEIGRNDIAKDAKGHDRVADSYPHTAFVSDSGALVGEGRGTTGHDRNYSVAVPADNLHKGVNELAIEVVRAPYDKAVADYWKVNAKDDRRELKEPSIPYDLDWYTCQVLNVSLAGGGPAVLPNASRPKTLQAWNSNPLTYDTNADMGDRCEKLQPVAIEGPRNGWVSGKVVVGLGKAIDGLSVTCTDLSPTGALKTKINVNVPIPATAIQTRYAVPFSESGRGDAALEELLEKPLDSFPVGPSGAAVVPIWFTVKIPKTAKPGDYSGQATIVIKGEDPITVPINLAVSEFAVPDTQDYRTWMELEQSPDTLAQEYNVPLWSDKHWDLIAQSMRYIGDIGSRSIQIPLIAQTNSGNEQSMVRWIKKPDGTFDYDLSIMDKYLDLVEKNMGKPKIVSLIAWELYLNTPKTEVKMTPEEEKKKDSDFGSMEKSWYAARWDLRGKGPAVTAYDPATKEIATVNLPRFEDAGALAIWKPLFDKIHADLAKRGLEKTMLLGMASDMEPSTAELKVLEEASGNLGWIDQGHGGNNVAGKKIDGISPIMYQSYVWNNLYPNDPDKVRTPEKLSKPESAAVYGWNKPLLNVEFRRFGALNDWPMPAEMLFPEIEISGGQRGLGRIGADFWAPVKDKRGERRGYVWDRYPQSKWHSCNLSSHMLDPGPDGPVATCRYEMMREGVQQCEARIAIEKVLINNNLKGRLGEPLAIESQKLLDDRIWEELKAFSGLQLTGRVYTTYSLKNYYNVFYYNAGGEAGGVWYTGSGWQDRAQKLFDLAAKVTKQAGE